VAYTTLVRQPRNQRTQVVSIQRGDQRMIRFARTGFSLSDTAIPERSEVSPMTLLVGMFALSSIPLVVLFFT
jgi:hypothetical protein